MVEFDRSKSQAPAAETEVQSSPVESFTQNYNFRDFAHREQITSAAAVAQRYYAEIPATLLLGSVEQTAQTLTNRLLAKGLGSGFFSEMATTLSDLARDPSVDGQTARYLGYAASHAKIFSETSLDASLVRVSEFIHLQDNLERVAGTSQYSMAA